MTVKIDMKTDTYECKLCDDLPGKCAKCTLQVPVEYPRPDTCPYKYESVRWRRV